MKTLLTIREVAARLRVSVSLSYALVNSGELKCHRIKSAIRVSEEQIAEYLEESQVVIPKRLKVVAKHF
jgi:excisionase family DNA binding protein